MQWYRMAICDYTGNLLRLGASFATPSSTFPHSRLSCVVPHSHEPFVFAHSQKIPRISFAKLLLPFAAGSLRLASHFLEVFVVQVLLAVPNDELVRKTDLLLIGKLAIDETFLMGETSPLYGKSLQNVRVTWLSRRWALVLSEYSVTLLLEEDVKGRHRSVRKLIMEEIRSGLGLLHGCGWLGGLNDNGVWL